MKTEVHYYHIQTPEVSMTILGGPLQADGDHVWLTRPDGQPVLRVEKKCVTPITREELARRITEDQKHQP